MCLLDGECSFIIIYIWCILKKNYRGPDGRCSLCSKTRASIVFVVAVSVWLSAHECDAVGRKGQGIGHGKRIERAEEGISPMSALVFEGCHGSDAGYVEQSKHQKREGGGLCGAFGAYKFGQS